MTEPEGGDRTTGPQSGIVGRSVEAIGRRAKLLDVELSGGLALTSHLKMTGQLFVVPAEARVRVIPRNPPID